VSFSTYCSSCACLKQGYKKKNKLIFYLETINWFSLSKYGFIIVLFTYKSLENKQGVYITIYIGLSVYVEKRLQHKNSFNRSKKKNISFIAEVKYFRVLLLDKEGKIVGVLSYVIKPAKFFSINLTAIRHYLKLDKLWKYKYYLSNGTIL
jgi:hypothetical protein